METILCLWSVSDVDYGRDWSEDISDEEVFRCLWKKREDLNASFFDMNAHYDAPGKFGDIFGDADCFEQNYNDECYDGGFWCKVCHLPESFVREVVTEIERKDKKEIAEISLVDKEHFGDFEEHEFKLKFYDGYAEAKGIRMEYPKLKELTDRMIKEIDDYTGGRITDSGYVTPYDVCVRYGNVVDFGIMDTTNGHNVDLVADINWWWHDAAEQFRPILIALYNRDRKEIGDKLGKTLSQMEIGWKEFAHDYLMQVADDNDLYTIKMFMM